ncbi:hypothetical protein [Kitasatospora sp. NPDC002040]|uniref:hypothetical protein n=1 Tax=Kitasatospora sp. NPDC002040 TaxID=3154661 RepID=UPI003320E86B
MAPDIAFFLAPDDRSAAVARVRNLDRFASVTGEWFSAPCAVEEWDLYFLGPLPDPPRRRLAFWRRQEPSTPAALRWIVPLAHDGTGVFALPPRLTRSLAGASPEELEELAARWAERLRSEDGDEMTKDDVPALVRAVAQLAETAVATGGNLYCFFY